MKHFLSIAFSLFSLCLIANPGLDSKELANSFVESEITIDNQLSDLNEINEIILNEELSHAQFVSKYPTLNEDAQLASAVVDELFDTDNSSPLGIHGFWWGLVLGCLGMAIVYLAMDSGEDRKEHVKNAAIGCLVSALVGGALWWQVF